MKHTPGPWTFGSDLNNNHAIHPEDVMQPNIGILENASVADARLCSAAPEMLDALDEALRCLKSFQNEAFRKEFNFDSSKSVFVIQKALKKARSE